MISNMDGTDGLNEPVYPTIETRPDGSVHVERPITCTVAMISGGGMTLPTHGSLVAALSNSRSADGIFVDEAFIQPTGPYLDDGRNLCVQRFLRDHSTDYLVFVDSDIEFTRIDLAHLLYSAWGRWHVLSGAYCSRVNGNPNNTNTIAYRNRRLNGPGSQLVALENAEVLAGVDPIEVDVVGMGFCVISRPILEYMTLHYERPCPWFFEPIADETHHGEDVGFCLRLRALGIPIGLHRGVRVSHYKTARFNYDGVV